MVEASIYSHMRAKIDLFVKIKAIEQQEAQLSNLLDNVPDSVLICTKPTELKASKGVYANKRFNEFFGADVLKFGT